MVCVPHPPPEIAAVVSAPSASSEERPRFRPVSRASANYVSETGALDFHCFYHSIRVKLTIRTDHFRFTRHHPLSFAYRRGDPLRPVTHEVRQFPGGVHRWGRHTIEFRYRNSADCGIPHGPPDCLTSEYGLSFRDSRGHVRHIDPPINNGGSIHN